MSAAGYSGTPLARKLGISAGQRVLALKPPEDYRRLLQPLPEDVVFEKKLSALTGVVHLFATESAELRRELSRLREHMPQDAAVWVSWPKKAAKRPTDITENVIREIALPLGLVDVKVCAVSEVWSGLKLVLRKALR
jgi:hypothetical protein